MSDTWSAHIYITHVNISIYINVTQVNIYMIYMYEWYMERSYIYHSYESIYIHHITHMNICIPYGRNLVISFFDFRCSISLWGEIKPCMCVCMYVCTPVCVYKPCMCVCMYVCTRSNHVCVYVCTYDQTMFVCMCVCMYRYD